MTNIFLKWKKKKESAFFHIFKVKEISVIVHIKNIILSLRP